MCTNCGCNSCNECNECSGQYSSNCKPILDVNCLPTLGRTSRHYLYRTPDSKLWYANANCTAWLELTRDEATETNQLNVLLDLTNRVIEVEQAIKAKKEDKPSDKEEKPADKEDKPTEKDNTISEALEALKNELKDKASVTGLEEVNKAVQKLSDALNAKVDKDTIYDDTEVKKAIEELKTTVAKLETKEDKDTVFDPTAIEAKVTALETRTTTLEATVEALKTAKESLEARVAQLEAKHTSASDHLE